MSFSKSATIIAALAMATTGALALSQNNAKAATVATVTKQTVARLYTSDGTLITNRGLAPNTPWAVGQIITVNGEKMYQVATNEYLKAADSSLSGNSDTSSDQTELIGTVKAGGAEGISKSLNDVSDNGNLLPGTSWKIGKYIVNRLGKKYVQVGTDYYVPAESMTFNKALPEPTSDYNFYYYPQMEPNYDPTHDYFAGNNN